MFDALYGRAIASTALYGRVPLWAIVGEHDEAYKRGIHGRRTTPCHTMGCIPTQTSHFYCTKTAWGYLI